MKVLSFLSLPLLFIYLTANEYSSVDQVDIKKGLIAYYSFNYCDARDESGNDSDGVLYGQTSCWCGIEDDGLLLDGQRDYIEFPGRINHAFNTTDFTISFYIKPEQYSVFEQSLFSKRQNCDSVHMLDIRIDVNRKNIITEVHQSARKYYPGISPDYKENGWMHYALVREGRMAYTYINGVLQQEGIRCSGVDITNRAIFSFSNSPCLLEGKARRFKGVLDELRIYERALSEKEILTIYYETPIENANSDCLT